MAYFIFNKNSEGLEGHLYRIAENESDLNNLNIDKSNYTIIKDDIVNFEDIRLDNIFVVKHINNSIVYNTYGKPGYKTAELLQSRIDSIKLIVKIFLDNNPNHALFDRWNNYYNQLNDLNLDNITFPLTTSLEQYFKEQNQPSLHPLQIP